MPKSWAMFFSRSSSWTFVATVLALQLATEAHACRVGGDQLLFVEAPPSGVLADTQSIRVHFTNVGPRFEEWRRRAPSDSGRILIGIARAVDEQSYFPVYATVSSCTHGFWMMAFGKSDPVWDGAYYLVGRFVPGSSPRFHAAGNWNSRWHL